MSNGWGVYVASVPGSDIVGTVGTSDARGVAFSGSGNVSASSSLVNYVSIWPYSAQYPWGTAAGTVSVASTSANDTSAGTGAQTVHLYGVDTDGKTLTEIVPLNGTTPAISNSTFKRLHQMSVVDSGTGGVNDGAITGTVSGSILSVIEPGVGRQNQATWTIPTDWQYGAILGQVNIFVGERQNTVVDFTLRVRPNGSNTWTQVFNSSVHNTAPLVVGSETPVVFGPGADLEFSATHTTRNNAKVFAAAEFLQL